MTTTRFEAACPWCGKENDAHSSLGGDFKPKAGDYSWCVSCMQLAVYGAGGTTLRKPTTFEWREAEALRRAHGWRGGVA